MHDLIVSGGTLVDGTGAPPRETDVAVDGARIAAIGRDLGPARERIDARGKLVTPGFVDIHTHYDGQATWDPLLSPSCWHGATTLVMGNCGVGFARAHRRAAGQAGHEIKAAPEAVRLFAVARADVVDKRVYFATGGMGTRIPTHKNPSSEEQRKENRWLAVNLVQEHQSGVTTTPVEAPPYRQ